MNGNNKKECFYCKKEFQENDVKFVSLFYPGERLCSECAKKEDQLYFQTNFDFKFPDFTEELDNIVQRIVNKNSGGDSR